MRAPTLLQALAVVAAIVGLLAIAVIWTLGVAVHEAEEDKWPARERGRAFGDQHDMTQSLAYAVSEVSSCTTQLSALRCMRRAKWFLWEAPRRAKFSENVATCRALREQTTVKEEQATILCRNAAPAGGWKDDDARRCPKLARWLLSFCMNRQDH